jgi:YidC/Oxa1 family membrane protein insertase
MNSFFMIFHDYGIAIILITVILRLVTFPLTQSSMKSMSKMKEMQPRLQALQEKYKNNPQLMQAKLMEFYKEEGVSPLSGLGGCLPMFIQMPIMISLFVVLRKAVELRGQSTFLLPWVKDLSQKEALFNLPFTIPVVNIDTVAILPFLMAILMFFQNKMTMKSGAAAQDPNQKMMLYMMPLMMFFMFYNMPAGLTLYFTFSSVFQLVQQYFVEKQKSKVTVVK